MPGQDDDPRDETRAERDDRNLAELLQELRVAGLGVQVLFGFLLSIPFTTKFTALSTAQRDLYVATLLLAALATALLLGPVAYHRFVFRQRQKENLVRAANRMAIAGLVAVALAVCLTVGLILSYVVPGVPALVMAIVIGAIFAGLWFAFPLSRRER
jgi:putative flippase GtrA